MATIDKNFKVKHGLIVEGTTATVNGENIITAANTTDDIAEGSTNLYFTDERAAAAVADEISTAVGAAVGALTTDSVPEGQEPNSKLYFTAERAQDAAAAALANGTHTNITVSYDDAANAISLTGAVTYTDQDAVDAVFAEATSDNTAYKLVQRGMNGEFSAGMITADLTGNVTGTVSSLSNHDTDGLTEGITNLYYTDSRAKDAVGNAVGTGLFFDTVTKGISVAANTYDAYGAAATAESNANSYTDTAVSNLVNGAPALLDTLNELAAAINNDESFATTIATQIGEKQDSLTAGTAINIDASTDTISVKIQPNGPLQVNASNEILFQNGDGLVVSPSTGTLSVGTGTGITLENGGTAVAVDTTVIASVSYVDTNFVSSADLPGQLDDYVPVTEKGQALGVATLDASGYVPASQLNLDVSGDISTAINALTTDDIEEGSTNLYFTNTRAVDALEAVVPNFTAVELNSISKQIAATTTVTASTSSSVYSFRASDYKVAKFLVKVSDGSNVEVSEVLLAVDSSDNISITEYGNVASNASLSSISASYVGGSFISLDVTPVSNGTVKVFGTLIV